MKKPNLRIRHSVRELEAMYESGNKKPLEDLMRAWKGIKELPPTDKRSFFNLGGYHGEPFIGPGATSSTYWGGYCNHGNVLFPTWHRVYVFQLEKALQSIVPDVMMPYWDETSEETLKNGVPWSLTNEKFELDGKEIDNPLRSFTFPVKVDDSVKGDDSLYTKPEGYETVRYPLSGLVGTPEAACLTKVHNAKFPNHKENVELLNKNVKAWLKGKGVSPEDPNPTKDGVYWQYVTCLKAPNYTAFSNTTSAAAWNGDNKGSTVVALESPHNDIHLAVGGFDVPNEGEFGQVPGANGDMGENNTAALDPIFFFHHCNVDRVFWLWQKQNGHTHDFDIISWYPGTNSVDSQGPTPGFPPNTELGMDSPLFPFELGEGKNKRAYISRDCINIETQMGFTYSEGSLEKPPTAERAKVAVKKLSVSGINRELFKGSFVIAAFADVGGKEVFLGQHSVLSRWNVSTCVNCLRHLEVHTHFDLDALSPADIEKAKFSIKIQHRDRQLPQALNFKLEVVD